MKKKYVVDIPSYLGKEIREKFYLQNLRFTQNESSSWTAVTLADKTGTMIGRIWAEWMNPEYANLEHTVVQVVGKVEIYRDRYELRVVRMDAVAPEDYEREDYVLSLPAAEKERLRGEIGQAISGISDARYKALAQEMLKPTILSSLSELPAADSYHHAYAGGWLKYTSELLKLCNESAELADSAPLVARPVNRDLLVCGVLLHNVGLLKHYKTNAVSYWKTNRSKMVGVSADTIAYLTVANCKLAADVRVPDLTDLVHLIVSMYDENVPPQSKEAVILSRVKTLADSVAAWDECFYHYKQKGTEKQRVSSAYFGYELER